MLRCGTPSFNITPQKKKFNALHQQLLEGKINSQSHFMKDFHKITLGAGVACWLERQTHDQKVASSNPGRSGGRSIFSKVSFVHWLLFSVHNTLVLPQWHIKDPGHSAKSAGGTLNLNMHTPLTRADYAAIQAECWNLSANELTRNLSENTRSQLSQPAEPLWTDPGLKSGINVRKLISTLI